MRRFLLSALILLPLTALAQSQDENIMFFRSMDKATVKDVDKVQAGRAESILYHKTMDKATVKDADKFLKKYPESIYAPLVRQMKDSLLLVKFQDENLSRISREEALRIAGGAAVDAIGWKKDKKEQVLALDKDFSLRVLSLDGALLETRRIPVYTMGSGTPARKLVMNMEVIMPLDELRYYVHFGYTNSASEYVEALYLPPQDIVFQAIYYGRALPLQDGDAYRIEGESPEMMDGLDGSSEISWLASRFKANPRLLPVSEADLLTDASIRWWFQKNSAAANQSVKLSFGVLDTRSSLVRAYRNAKKVSGKSNDVAVIDIRGYTVIVAGSKSSGKYRLVWCERKCANKKTDPYIYNYYFENDGTTLELIYYKGNTTFKRKISFANQVVRHLK